MSLVKQWKLDKDDFKAEDANKRVLACKMFETDYYHVKLMCIQCIRVSKEPSLSKLPIKQKKASLILHIEYKSLTVVKSFKYLTIKRTRETNKETKKMRRSRCQEKDRGR